MKQIFFIISFLISLAASALPSQAKVPPSGGGGGAPDSISLRGRVVDSFTREVVDSVFMEILSADTTTVIDTLWNRGPHKEKFGVWGEWDTDGYITKLAKYGHYLIRCTKRGYKPSITPLNIPRKKYNKRVTDWEPDEILLKKSNSYDFDTNMKEVAVTATRIKMVQNGDTVVYNADAFELSEGSMLDELVRQLPGVELKDGGQIYVNGNKVDELLVNGKHFFQGNAKVALDNLPAYMVQNVKTYQKASDQAYLDKHHEEMKKKDPWVIDVNLKREYNTGWLGNVEGGYGTNNHYMGRLFLTRFTDHSRITAYANANDINNFSRPGTEGSWEDDSTPTGEVSQVSGGINFHVDGKKSKTEFNTSVRASHSKTTNNTDVSSTTFLTGGDVFNRSRSWSENTSTSIGWDADLRMPKKDFMLMVRPNIDYNYSKNNGSSTAATFNADPLDSYRGASLDSLYAPVGSARLDSILTNRHKELSKGVTKTFNAGIGGWGYTKAPWNGEIITLQFSASHNRTDNDSYSQYDLVQKVGDRDYRNRYTLSPTRNTSIIVGLNHDIWEFRHFGTIGISYSYFYDYNNGRRSLYDLHQYKEWGADAGRTIGLLPSTTDSLSNCIDAKNSYHTLSRNNQHDVSLNLQHGGDWGVYYVSVGIEHEKKHIEDNRDSQQRNLTRKFNLPSFDAGSKIKDFDFNIRYSQSTPDMNYLLNIIDDSNPLSISMGNADLKNSSSENFNVRYSHNNMKHQSNWGAGGNVSVTQNSIGNAMTYNRTTGVYTYQPRNISGNWDASLYGDVNVPFGEKKLVTLINRVNLTYNRNVDFAQDMDEPDTKSVVHNYGATDYTQIRFQKGGYTASLNASADYAHATSDRTSFSTINTIDFSYGASCSLKLPWSFQFDMDLTMHSRRGYEDATMNDNNLVWNAALSKSFLKGKNLTLKIMGHDILQQLASVQRTVNAQGRTETWFNTQPAYGMLTLAYRLNLQPKKKKTT